MIYGYCAVCQWRFRVEGDGGDGPAKRTTAPAFGLLTRERAVLGSRGEEVRETWMEGRERLCSSSGCAMLGSLSS